jgi:hypothetical protein
MVPSVRVERRAASLTLIDATLSRTATSLCPHRSYRPRARSSALLERMKDFVSGYTFPQPHDHGVDPAIGNE